MILRLLSLFLLGGLAVACGGAPAPAASPPSAALPAMVFPTDEWITATPTALGVDPVVLDTSLAYLARHCKEDGLTEVMVIRNGYLIWAGDSIHKVHDIWSCTKSFVSTAVGMMADEGILALDQAVATHEPTLAANYPEATYQHFLTMTSGYNAEGDSRWPDQTYQDWSATPYVPTDPLFAPGTAYAYWDEAMIMLGKALTQASGSTLNDYLNARLFQKIGISQRDWWGEGTATNGLPVHFGGTGLRMSAAEHARFGHLVLNGGRWREEQIVPADFLAAATVNQVPTTIALGDTGRKNTDGRGRYGYNWWVINQDAATPVAAAFTSGLNHNVCLVVPAWNMVIVRMGVDGNPATPKHEVYAEVLRRLAPGVRK